MIYRFENFLLNTDQRELRCDDDVRPLEPQVLALLELLVANPDRMISKDEIVEKIWDGRIVSDGSINSRILSLRKALDDDGKQQRLIKTVHGQGFRFVGKIDQTDSIEVKPESSAPSRQTVGPAGTLVDEANIPTVAVLPFDNMSDDPGQSHLANGMCEDILTILSKISGLKVIARNTSFAYGGKAVDIRKIGAETGASHVLEGSVRKSGNRLRVTGQLIDAASGLHVWAERYDRELDDIFAIQDDMTRQIVSAMHVSLIEGDLAPYWTGSTNSHEAWWQQTQAMPLTIRTHSREDILRGRSFAEAALAIDREYAEAWMTVGLSHLFEAGGCWVDDPMISIAAATEAYEKAFALNPKNALVRSGKGLIDIYHHNHDEGMAMIDAAVKAAPDNLQIRVQWQYGQLYCGRYDSNAKPPLDVPAGVQMMLPILTSAIYLVKGDMEQSLAFARTAIERIPDEIQGHAFAMLAMAALGMDEDMEKSRDKILRRNPAFNVSYYKILLPLEDDSKTEEIARLARKAGLPER